MPRNGTGTYNLPAGNPVVTGTTISSTWANNTFNDVGSALTQSLSKDGQTTATANLPMGGFRLTNVGIATAGNEYITATQNQGEYGIYIGTVGGTADVITLTASPAITAYAAGQRFTFVASGANTTNVTVNVSSLGAKALTKFGSVALVANDIPSGSIVTMIYDGTRFQVEKIDFRTAAVAYTGNNTHAGTETFTGAVTVQNYINYAATTGTDTYAATLSPAITAYVTGAHYFISFGNANTVTTPTLNLNSIGAKTIKKVAGGITTDLADNDIRSGQFVELVYDGTNMQMQSTLGNAAAGGGIDPSISDTYANIIAATCTATEEGQIGVPTNSYYSMARCDGSAWDWFLGGRSVTIPASGDYAWVNQNSATLDTTGGGIYLEAIATGSNSLSQRVKSTAATPFTVTMAIAPNVWSSDQSVGIMLRESGTSKILTFGPEVVSAVAAKYSVIKWTNSTTFSAYQAQNIGAAAVVSRPVWLRVTHDGTNIVWKLSNDGANFITVSTATKTNFFTTDADQIGFYAKSGSSNQIVGVTILSVD